jgi:tripartite-type tricarboxylate transporter receptor subunit TctC
MLVRLRVRNVTESGGFQLNAEINRLKLPEVIELFHKQGVEPLGGTADAFTAFQRDQASKWAKVVKESGAKAE